MHLHKIKMIFDMWQQCWLLPSTVCVHATLVTYSTFPLKFFLSFFFSPGVFSGHIIGRTDRFITFLYFKRVRQSNDGDVCHNVNSIREHQHLIVQNQGIKSNPVEDSFPILFFMVSIIALNSLSLPSFSFSLILPQLQ